MVGTVMSVELFRQEGEEYRSIRLCVNASGSVSIDGHDLGPSVQRHWGEDKDYEFAVIVPGTAVPKISVCDSFERNIRDEA